MTSRVLSTSPSETQKPGLEYSQRANLPRIQAHPCDSGLSQAEHCKFPASVNLSFFFFFFAKPLIVKTSMDICPNVGCLIRPLRSQ